MIEAIKIENYKSIEELELPLGRVNVLIGENGAGKSNILEAITFLAAALSNKLDNEFLHPRGVRVVEPSRMRSMFANQDEDNEGTQPKPLKLSFRDNDDWQELFFESSNDSFPKWEVVFEKSLRTKLANSAFKSYLDSLYYSEDVIDEGIRNFVHSYVDDETFTPPPWMLESVTISMLNTEFGSSALSDFLIYSPENSMLRSPDEAIIEPLGINGEGLFRLIKVLHKTGQHDKIDAIKSLLAKLSWFEDFDPDVNMRENRMSLRDRFLDEEFDQRSANEGFLFLLFYATLLVADETPQFFAIDNIDASLNPKLCVELIKQIVQLSEKHEKQVILTTHNPAILDGLNLHDDQQRLFIVSRNKAGRTRVRRVQKPPLREGQKPVKLSTMFINGSLGGLPTGF